MGTDKLYINRAKLVSNCGNEPVVITFDIKNDPSAFKDTGFAITE
jgi:hypothetical protein